MRGTNSIAGSLMATSRSSQPSFQSHFEALRILLKRPQDWNPEVLGKLRHDLRANDYDEKRLRTAHEKVYRKQLADVISMIKHAADQQAPLLTAEERVTRAVEELQAF